ncbi:hypothetical protein [Corynebacterium bovis]|uniref:hypothetical protein n=1 Tax=Corynebacterium bovis TaxID=36808 RepID=UPI000F634BAF|nr:hypothetical protein [Corynebacterium bovis]RRO89420.1 hypothetical protein CXF30_03270 [Corynebacterium bovis]
MSSTSSPRFRDDPEYLRRRRAIIRENHPDRGGSDDRLIRELRRLDEQWARRESVTLPSFIPDDVARQAQDLADQYSEEIRRRAAAMRSRGQVVATSSVSRTVRRTAGRVLTGAGRRVRSRIPRGFPGAKRFTDTVTGTGRTGPGTSPDHQRNN